jgi:hypothetical protein
MDKNNMHDLAAYVDRKNDPAKTLEVAIKNKELGMLRAKL